LPGLVFDSVKRATGRKRKKGEGRRRGSKSGIRREREERREEENWYGPGEVKETPRSLNEQIFTVSDCRQTICSGKRMKERGTSAKSRGHDVSEKRERARRDEPRLLRFEVLSTSPLKNRIDIHVIPESLPRSAVTVRTSSVRSPPDFRQARRTVGRTNEGRSAEYDRPISSTRRCITKSRNLSWSTALQAGRNEEEEEARRKERRGSQRELQRARPSSRAGSRPLALEDDRCRHIPGRCSRCHSCRSAKRGRERQRRSLKEMEGRAAMLSSSCLISLLCSLCDFARGCRTDREMNSTRRYTQGV